MKVKDILTYSIKDIFGKRIKVTRRLIIFLLFLIFSFSLILIGINRGIKLYLLNKLKESNGIDRLKVNHIVEYQLNKKIEVLSNIELFEAQQKFLRSLKYKLSKYIEDISFIALYPKAIIINNKKYDVKTFYPNDPFYKKMKIYRGEKYTIKDEDRAVAWIVNDEEITEDLPIEGFLPKNKKIEIKGILKEKIKGQNEEKYAIIPSKFLKRYLKIKNIMWWYSYIYVKNLKYIFKCKNYIENKSNFKLDEKEKLKIFKKIIINKIDILFENNKNILNEEEVPSKEIEKIIDRNFKIKKINKNVILKDLSNYFPKKEIPKDIKSEIENILSIKIKYFKSYFLCDYPYKEVLEKYLKIIELIDKLKKELLFIFVIFFILLLSISSSWLIFQKQDEIALLRCMGLSKIESIFIYYLENMILIIISLIIVYPLIILIINFMNPLIIKSFSIKYSIHPISFYSIFFKISEKGQNLLLEEYYLYIFFISTIISTIVIFIILSYKIFSNSLVKILKGNI